VRRCFGFGRNLHRCGREGPWILFCQDHRRQPLGWLSFIVFTAFAGSLGIYQFFFTPHQAQQELAVPSPHSFDIHDPRVRFVQGYDLKKEAGARLETGKCPDEPCFRFEVRRLRLEDNPPTVHVTLSGAWDGNRMMEWRGLGFGIPVKPGCGLALVSRQFDMRFEIQEDRVSFLRAWVAILDGTGTEPHAVISPLACPS